ncbi:serine protease 58-like [Microcebus murinus]|uniref:Serine protease 58 n=1 Tax=Microcebus murinus TaxID=30608 RepID=A0A8C5XVP0_MICMU|nr:serine protease 58-like [Microcebus murinus]XP_012623520.1 serine protease 58-like [Microcebus murinus]
MKFIPLWALLNLPVVLAFNPDYVVADTPPYLVFLKSDYLPCAGALIHPLWVVTAAHCNLPKLRLIFGATIPSDLGERHLQVLDYEKLIYHPHFSVTSIEYDIMLIKLQTEVELNDYVKVVDLPYEAVPVNTMCNVSTWSYNICDMSKEPDLLQTVEISVISQNECRDAYKTHNIRENMLCVGIVPGRRQPCREVSAALAVCNGILQGIMSFADGCILRADVGIYAKLSNYRHWIEKVIQNN